MPMVEANGLQVAYAADGDGPPLMVLHEAGSTGAVSLGPAVEGLSSRFRVFRADARGHGATRWDAADGFTTADLVADVIAFADALDLATFHLLGFSMGATTALNLAAAHADRLRTLVVIGISPDREPRTRVARHALDPERIERDDPSWARRLDARHDPVQGQGAWHRLLPAIAADVADQPLLTAAAIHAIGVPTLVACGDRDPFVPVGHAWALARELPHARLLVAPDCGHELPRERPAILAAALDDVPGEERAP
jgi:pimeloyl-ACP methyl ester carboxylesterase